ncbi:TPA: phage antirepressor N-terminal domain-containing protein [Pseudomonas aeruginosa]
MSSITTINVPFHGNSLYVVNYNGEPFVPMKPIVEGMGLSWEPQLRKLNQRFTKGMIKMVIPSIGGAQETVCLAMHKLTGWLFSIMPNKVKPEIRDKVIQYQEECDDVLYEYWTTGEVKKKTNFRQSTAKELIPLRQTAERLIAHGVGNIYPDIWKHIHKEFGVEHINELLPEQIPLAISYLNALEGEYIPKQEAIAEVCDFNIPLEWWDQHKVALKAKGVDSFSHKEPCYFPYRLLYGDAQTSPSAISQLLFLLTKAGFDVSGAKLEHYAHRHYAEISHRKLSQVDQLINPVINGVVTCRISPPMPMEWR